MTPRVFWDGYGLDRPSGVNTYGQNLRAALVERGISPEIIVPEATFFPKLLKSKPLWPGRVARIVEDKAGRSAVVLHGLSNFNVARPRGINAKTVLTVHDLIPFLAPEGVSRAYYFQLKALLPRALRTADAVVCVSDWTRATLAERYPWAAGKCVVIRHGLAKAPENVGNEAAGDKLTLFYQARGEVYKQIPLYLDILEKLGKNARGILLTDERGREAAKGRALELEVFANVSDAAYQALFARADVYVHTSRFEGYGLPAADALRHAVPVVYQAGSALDELLPEGAVAEKAPVSAWVSAVYEAKAQKGTQKYREMREKLLAGLPTWDDAAQAHAAIYSDV